MLSAKASADTFEVRGICYYVEDLTSSTTASIYGYSSENADFAIPASVTYNGKTYSVTSIGGGAFSGCRRLVSMAIPCSVTSIGAGAFSNSSLSSIIIPNSVTSIGGSAFSNCRYLTSISLPNSVTSIETQTFLGCSGLTSIYIPNSVTSIGNSAFWNCYGLTSIELPNSVTSIGNLAFSKCEFLRSIKLSSSLTSIGNGAFSTCWNLTSIELPNSLTTIGDGAFSDCVGLTSIEIESGNAVYDSRNGCNAIIETATNTLILGCKNTIIPNSVTSIGDYAFSAHDGLISIEIPNSVMIIGDYAFSNCSGLKDVYCANPVPCEVSSSAFNGIYGTATLHVPAGAKAAYRAAEGWKKFANIVQPKYEVRWMIDNEIIQTDSVEVGEPIVYSGGIPTKEGHTFCWNEIPKAMPAEDITITGSFIANTYTVTYMLDGEVYRTVDVRYGEAIPWIEEPTKEGHTFSGWSYTPATMPAYDFSIIGVFVVNTYTVTYMLDGEVYRTVDVRYGEAIPRIEEPTKEGYTFSGWGEIPATMPAKDVTITANFTVNTYMVTYMIDGEVYKTVEVKYGEAIPVEEAPTKEGYTFSGWSYIPKTMPAEDVTVYGMFTLTDGIAGITYGEDIVAVYTLNGRKVNKVLPGKIYIFEYSDGRKVKANVRK